MVTIVKGQWSVVTPVVTIAKGQWSHLWLQSLFSGVEHICACLTYRVLCHLLILRETEWLTLDLTFFEGHSVCYSLLGLQSTLSEADSLSYRVVSSYF